MTEVAAALIWDKDKFMICRRPAGNAEGSEGQYTDGVDDLPLKLSDAPTKKIKVIYKEAE